MPLNEQADDTGAAKSCFNRRRRVIGDSRWEFALHYCQTLPMTAAICIHCGADKFGALFSCPICKFTPHTETDQAKSILLSDHFLSPAELREKSKLIRDGKSILFPEDRISAITDVSRYYNDDIKTLNEAYFKKVIVLMTLCVIGVTLILLFVEVRWLKAVAAILLGPSLVPTVVLWVDFLEPLRRTCRSCHKRGVTEGTVAPFEFTENYDKWNYCRNCSAFYLRVDGQWVPPCKSENPCDHKNDPMPPMAGS